MSTALGAKEICRVIPICNQKGGINMTIITDMNQVYLEYGTIKHEPFKTLTEWMPTAGYYWKLGPYIFNNFEKMWAARAKVRLDCFEVVKLTPEEEKHCENFLNSIFNEYETKQNKYPVDIDVIDSDEKIEIYFKQISKILLPI